MTITKLCECGCGDPAPIATRTDRAAGYVRGLPRRFIQGHQSISVPPAERFWPKVRVGEASECWLWLGAKTPLGYGQFRYDGRTGYAHRWSYEAARGAIGASLDLDHLCRNPACVNPSHLEAVTHRANVLRGVAPTARNARKTHCPRGHALTPENNVRGCKGRQCRTCYLEHMKTQYRRRKAMGRA